MASVDIDTDRLRTAAEDLLPLVAGHFDGLATELGEFGSSAASALLADNVGGNGLGEAIVEAHKFLYSVLEDSGDVHRAAGTLVSECCDEYEASDAETAGELQLTAEDINTSYAQSYERADSGDYEGSEDALVVGDEYNIAEEMTEAYQNLNGAV